MIEVRHARFSYGDVPALADVSLEALPGELLAVTGPSAAGKSTLALLLSGLLVPAQGDCLIDGASTRHCQQQTRRLVGLVFQDPEDQAVYRRVADDVAFGPRNLGADDVAERVDEALQLAGIQGLAGRDIETLSGGERQLAAIAGALALRPRYLVLDEPTSFLDAAGARAVRQALERLRGEGRGIVLITQDPGLAAAADRMIVLAGGRVIAAGPPREVFLQAPGGLIGLPDMVRLGLRLRAKGVKLDRLPMTPEEAAEMLCR